MKILAPHKEQEGWVYVRVSRSPQADDVHLSYNDSAPWRRVISSRRVEEAVETADYLKRCAEEGLVAYFGRTESHRWAVGDSIGPRGRGGATLREAYYRYHAAREKETA